MENIEIVMQFLYLCVIGEVDARGVDRSPAGENHSFGFRLFF